MWAEACVAAFLPLCKVQPSPRPWYTQLLAGSCRPLCERGAPQPLGGALATHRLAPEQSRRTYACARLPWQLAGEVKVAASSARPCSVAGTTYFLRRSACARPVPSSSISAPAPRSGRIVCICDLLQAADRLGDGVAALSHVLEVLLALVVLVRCCLLPAGARFPFSVPPQYKAAECRRVQQRPASQERFVCMSRLCWCLDRVAGGFSHNMCTLLLLCVPRLASAFYSLARSRLHH